jgi:hypothetical protein
VGVEQGLEALLERLVPGTGGSEEGGALGLRPGQSIVEDFFCVHGSPLSLQARKCAEKHHGILQIGRDEA